MHKERDNDKVVNDVKVLGKRGVARLEDDEFRRMSGTKRAWLEFRRNRFALVGTAFIVFIAFMATFAPIVSTHDPYRQSLRYQDEAADGGTLAGHG